MRCQEISRNGQAKFGSGRSVEAEAIARTWYAAVAEQEPLFEKIQWRVYDRIDKL
jgi:hypothetical protein